MGTLVNPANAPKQHAVFMNFTDRELREGVDRLTNNLDNWKMPIGCIIQKEDFEKCHAACIFYLGCPLIVIREKETTCGTKWLDVWAEGYYNAVGA